MNSTIAGGITASLVPGGMSSRIIRPSGPTSLLDFPNLTYWFSARQLTDAYGNPVPSIPDLSLNGHTVANSGTAPTAVFRNTIRRLVFDGATTDTLSSSFLDSSYDTAFTLFMRATPAIVPPQFRMVVTFNSNQYFAGAIIPPASNLYAPFVSLSSPDFTDVPNVIAAQNLDVVRFDGATMTIIRNGVVASFARSQVLGLSGGIQLGGHPGGSQYRYLGWIDDVALFNRALTDAEIAQATPLIGYTFPVGSKASGVGTRQLACDGDSTTAGVSPATPYPTQLNALLVSGWNTVNYGVGGQTVVEMTDDVSATVDTQFVSSAAQCVCIAMAGSNDLHNSIPYQVIYDNMVAYCRGRLAVGWQLIVGTVLPSANAGEPPDFETQRVALNALIRTNYASFANGLADFAQVPQLEDPNNPLYYQADLTHPTTLGNTYMANCALAAINAL